MLDIQQIFNCLPHRSPFLLIDRVLDYTENESLDALKNVTFNEPFFSGHFPENPIMPGVLIIEAMAQATSILSFKSNENNNKNILYMLAGVDNARFKRPVIPGDQLILKIKSLKKSRGIWKFNAQAFVDDKLVAKAELMSAGKEITA
jgi:3-hydroxyacyl-[acyl-carrier-protein] dehydratase